MSIWFGRWWWWANELDVEKWKRKRRREGIRGHILGEGKRQFGGANERNKRGKCRGKMMKKKTIGGTTPF
jgi:hypothetical protein